MSDSTDVYSADQLRKEMRRVREDIREDVQDVVEGAQDLTDWRFYVKSYPWACIGAAVFAGYMAVPAKSYVHSPDADTLKKLAASNKLVVKQSPVSQKNNGVVGALLTIGMNTVGRAAISYLGQQAGKMIAPDLNQNSQTQGSDQ